MLNLPSSPLWVTWCTRMFGIEPVDAALDAEHVLGRERIGFEELEERILGGVDRPATREPLQGDPGLDNLIWGAGRESLEETGDSLEAREHVEEAVLPLEDRAVRREPLLGEAGGLQPVERRLAGVERLHHAPEVLPDAARQTTRRSRARGGSCLRQGRGPCRRPSRRRARRLSPCCAIRARSAPGSAHDTDAPGSRTRPHTPRGTACPTGGGTLQPRAARGPASHWDGSCAWRRRRSRAHERRCRWPRRRAVPRRAAVSRRSRRRVCRLSLVPNPRPNVRCPSRCRRRSTR